MTTYYNLNFAQAYGDGAYNANCYNDAVTVCTTSGSTGLSNTGIMVAGVVTLAAVILLVAIVVRIWRRPRKEPATESVPTGDQNDQQ